MEALDNGTVRRGIVAVGLLWAAACAKGQPSLLVEVTSTLEIPRETDSLVARVFTIDGQTLLEEQSYALGASPNDVWPQTLPIVSGEKSPQDFAFVVELRKTRMGAPSDVMGFASAQARFPEIGTRKVPLPVARVCSDEDYDEYGLGLGCRGADCDDTRSEVPASVSCDVDAGVRPDAGVRDVGVRDGGPVPCNRDDPSSCGEGQVCTPLGRCALACTQDRECADRLLMCLQPIGACLCRIPCRQGGNCGPYACIDGCCQIN
ncbi:MAG: hypothetical protein HY791_27270 [Deltaproteobacteria bacterium]|nr:hypothetical protein [Deltaproteobacteria bacterium]